MKMNEMIKRMIERMGMQRKAHQAKMETPVLLGQGYILVSAEDGALVMTASGLYGEMVARPAGADLCGVPHMSQEKAEMLAQSNPKVRAIHVVAWHMERIAELSSAINELQSRLG